MIRQRMSIFRLIRRIIQHICIKWPGMSDLEICKQWTSSARGFLKTFISSIRKKKATVEESLRQQITTRHTIKASFGQAVFFEFLLTNPYNIEHNFEILWDDSEVRLVTDASEWTYLRRIHSIKGGIENRLIAMRPGGVTEIYLLPNETISIPFVFQSLCSGDIDYHQSALLKKKTNWGVTNEHGIAARSIDVFSFVKLIARFHFWIRKNYQLRFWSYRFHPDIITLTNRWDFSGLKTMWFENPSKLQLHFGRLKNKKGQSFLIPLLLESDIFDVMSLILSVLFQTRLQIAIQSKLNSNIEQKLHPTQKLFISSCIMMNIVRFWLKYGESLFILYKGIYRLFLIKNRLDVTCTLGQTNNAGLIVKGGAMSRAVQCFSNQPLELLVILFKKNLIPRWLLLVLSYSQQMRWMK